jgi:hypothetical protein
MLKPRPNAFTAVGSSDSTMTRNTPPIRAVNGHIGQTRDDDSDDTDAEPDINPSGQTDSENRKRTRQMNFSAWSETKVKRK